MIRAGVRLQPVKPRSLTTANIPGSRSAPGSRLRARYWCSLKNPVATACKSGKDSAVRVRHCTGHSTDTSVQNYIGLFAACGVLASKPHLSLQSAARASERLNGRQARAPQKSIRLGQRRLFLTEAIFRCRHQGEPITWALAPLYYGLVIRPLGAHEARGRSRSHILA